MQPAHVRVDTCRVEHVRLKETAVLRLKVKATRLAVVALVLLAAVGGFGCGGRYGFFW